MWRIRVPCIDTGLIWLKIIHKPLKSLLPMNKTNRFHSRNLLFLLVLVVVLDCGLPLGMPGGGFMNPAPVSADKGDDGNHSRNGDGWKENRDRNEYSQDMDRLDAERDRERNKLEEEYNRELDKIEEEFQRDIAEEDDPVTAEEKHREKRDDLKLKFDEKQQQLAEWYEEKASEIEGR